MNNFDLPGPKE